MKTISDLRIQKSCHQMLQVKILAVGKIMTYKKENEKRKLFTIVIADPTSGVYTNEQNNFINLKLTCIPIT